MRSKQKIIRKLDPKKASQTYDFKNGAFFAKYICNDVYALTCSSKFCNTLK